MYYYLESTIPGKLEWGERWQDKEEGRTSYLIHQHDCSTMWVHLLKGNVNAYISAWLKQGKEGIRMYWLIFTSYGLEDHPNSTLLSQHFQLHRGGYRAFPVESYASMPIGKPMEGDEKWLLKAGGKVLLGYAYMELARLEQCRKEVEAEGLRGSEVAE